MESPYIELANSRMKNIVGQLADGNLALVISVTEIKNSDGKPREWVMLLSSKLTGWASMSPGLMVVA